MKKLVLVGFVYIFSTNQLVVPVSFFSQLKKPILKALQCPKLRPELCPQPDFLGLNLASARSNCHQDPYHLFGLFGFLSSTVNLVVNIVSFSTTL